jgi:hypothetical protein
MPLLKSLICLKGYDNGRRFLIISIVCYLLLVILTPLLSKAAILMVILILTTSPILASSSVRRIRDAGFAAPLAAIPLVVYWLNLFGITYIEHSSRWALLVLATITTIAMATISNARVRHNHSYQMGYDGPVNLNVEKNSVVNRDRIEPTIAGHKNSQGQAEKSHAAVEEYILQEVQSSHSHLDESSNNGWEHQLGLWFKANQKISIMSLAVIVILTLLVVSMPSFEEGSVEKIATEQPKIETAKSRLNKIEMPDQFWLMLDQNDSLTIGWEGDFKTDAELAENGSYWSATTGKGDQDCVDLHFSLGKDIRTLLVTVKNGGDYYADFSPVDTEIIIKSIAEKDRFKLCGYEFTLKGTRSVLRKNKKYYEYLRVDL